MSTEDPGGARQGAAPHVECVAFLAAAPRLGRTATVANLTLLLAGARERVLIVDWSGEEPSARGYFARFGVGPSAEMTALRDLFDELTEGRAGAWRAARFQPPGDIGPVDLVEPAGDRQGVPRLPAEEPIEDVVARLRAAIDQSAYDYVLVDAPTAPEPRIVDVVARGADQVVVLFEPSRPSVAGAATLAESVAAAALTGVRVLPLRVEPPGSGAPARPVSADLVAEWFGEFLLDGDRPILDVPFVPAQADRQVLVTLADERGSEAARSYSRLAAELTRGEVTGPPEFPAELYANYRAALNLEEPPEAGDFTIVHTWPDRRYADWVREGLREGGARGVLAAPGEPTTGRAIWIVSPQLLAALPNGLPDRPDDLALLVPGADAAAVPTGMRSIALAEGAARHLRLRLLGALGLVGDETRRRSGTVRPRFPRDARPAPLNTNFAMPPRRSFVGRVDELTRMRDRLLGDTDGCEPYVLGGPPGIGKTSVVLEYLRLFGEDYDVIWWISARTPDLVRTGLAELADALGVAARGDKVAAAIAELRARRGGWLLIYDDAERLGDLAGLIPVDGPGHALVTSRSLPEPGQDARERAYAGGGLDPIDTARGAALLRERVPGLTPEDAAAVAEQLRGLPIALHLAAAWLGETIEWLADRSLTTEAAATWAAAEYNARVAGRLAEPGMDVPAACLEVTLRTLEEADPDRPLDRVAVRLLELCAWLAPEGVRHGLLSSVPFLTGLGDAAGPEGKELIDADSMLLDQVLHVCARYGLGQMGWKRAPIFRTHRMVQELVRARLVRAGLADTRRGQALEALGRSVPLAVDAPILRYTEHFVELRRHLGPSGAAESDAPWARRWVVEQTRFQHASGDDVGGRELIALAEGALERWPDDLYKGRLLGQMANMRRTLGDFRAAYRHGERALAILRGQGAAGERWALAELRGRSADLRGLGRFAESLGEIQGVYEGMCQLYGDDHRETVVTRINLAESAFLMGQYSLALSTAEAALRQREDEFGPMDWIAFRIARRVGDYLGAVGEWRKARSLLGQRLRTAREMPPPRNPTAELRLVRSLAIAERCDRGLDSDRPHRRINEALRGLRALHGPDDPSALAAELSLGVELAVVGNHRAAIKRAERCQDGFAAVYADDAHPFVQVCRIDRGVFTLAAGRASEALDVLLDAEDTLADTIGEQHPWTIAAVLHQARALTALGRFDAARERADQARVEALDSLGEDHPYTKAAEEAFDAAHTGHAGGTVDSRATVYLDVPFI